MLPVLSRVKRGLVWAFRGSKVSNRKVRLVIDCIGYIGMFMSCTFLVLMGYAYHSATVLKGLESDIKPVPAKIIPSTLGEVQAVVESDQTDTIGAGRGFNCIDFAWAVKRALQWQGIDSAILGLYYKEGFSGHAILIIPTSDKGWVALEPQNDQFMPVLKVGDYYDGQKITKVVVLVLDWVDVQEFEDNPVFDCIKGEQSQ
jgi:hypothetical protein